jgi:hypothetical protein
VVDEAMRRLRDSERWMPAISEVLAACGAVQDEWSRKIAAAEDEARAREQREAREEARRRLEWREACG